MAKDKVYETEKQQATTVKVSKASREFADRIVDKLGDFHHDAERGHRVELVSMGLFTTPFHKTKAKAADEMAERIGLMLDDGSLQLSDTWEKDNLG